MLFTLPRLKKWLPLLAALLLLSSMSSAVGDVPVAKAAPGDITRFEAYNLPGQYIRHYDYVARVEANISVLDDSRFIERPGLADPNEVSYESVNYPGYYLKHYAYKIVLKKYDGSSLFREDATFRKVSGLADASAISLQSYNFPSRYIRHYGNEMRIDPISSTQEKQDATFKPTASGSSSSALTYTIVSRTGGKLLEESSGSALVQRGLQGSSVQLWRLVAVAGGYYKLVNNSSGKLIDVAANGDAVLASDTGSTSQHWRLERISTGDYFKLVNRSSGKVLDVYQNSTADGNKIIAWNDVGTANQQWYIAPRIQGSVTYTLWKASNPTADQLDAYTRITSAMDAALRYYNQFSTATKHINVYYNTGVPTAEASSNGTLSFGANRSFMNQRTAMHEIAHTLGAGTGGEYSWRMSGGSWNGDFGNTELRAINGGSSAFINGDGFHFWPYGLNFDSEVQTDADYIRHVRIVNAMKSDGM